MICDKPIENPTARSLYCRYHAEEKQKEAKRKADKKYRANYKRPKAEKKPKQKPSVRIVGVDFYIPPPPESMHDLAMDNVEARKLGMSYGEYSTYRRLGGATSKITN
jgi:hypothetical protein